MTQYVMKRRHWGSPSSALQCQNWRRLVGSRHPNLLATSFRLPVWWATDCYCIDAVLCPPTEPWLAVSHLLYLVTKKWKNFHPKLKI